MNTDTVLQIGQELRAFSAAGEKENGGQPPAWSWENRLAELELSREEHL